MDQSICGTRGIDRPKEEVLLNTRVSLATRRGRRVDQEAEDGRPWNHDAQHDVFRSWCTQVNWRKTRTRVWQPCGTTHWTKQISVNKRNRRRHWGAHSFALSWNVACVSAVSSLLTMERFSRNAQESDNFLGDLGKDLRWSVFCVQELASSTGEMVTETAKVTRCLQRHHVWDSDAWWLLSQLKSLPASSVTSSTLREDIVQSTSVGVGKKGGLGRPSLARDIPHESFACSHWCGCSDWAGNFAVQARKPRHWCSHHNCTSSRKTKINRVLHHGTLADCQNPFQKRRRQKRQHIHMQLPLPS